MITIKTDTRTLELDFSLEDSNKLFNQLSRIALEFEAVELEKRNAPVIHPVGGWDAVPNKLTAKLISKPLPRIPDKVEEEDSKEEVVGKDLDLTLLKESMQSNGLKAIEPVTKEHLKEYPRPYKGFLFIRCEECGTDKSFFTRNFISHFSCECGHTAPLGSLIKAHVNCPDCGNKVTFLTNVKDEQFDMECINCHSTVNMKYNDRRNRVEPI